MGQKLGQHFLKNKKWAELAASEVSAFKNIIEIGPGRGALTEQIILKASADANFTAIEKDSKFIIYLKEKFPEATIIDGDVLKILPSLMEEQRNKYAIIGNIPYYLTGFLLRIIGDSKNRPDRCALMIQKEVAERICAAKGDMNRLSASVQIWGKPKILALVPRGDFSPPPAVESAIIEINVDESRQNSDLSSVFAAIRTIFAQPRKTLLNNLSTAVDVPKGEILKEIQSYGISENFRPQDLDIEQLFLIAKKFKKYFDKS